jgi:beta-glucosidase
MKVLNHLFSAAFFLFAACMHLSAQPENALPPYKNRFLPVEERLKDLLGRMTLEEKIRMVSGSRKDDGSAASLAGTTPATILAAVDSPSKTMRNIRLGIPELIMTDGPLGPNGKGAATNYGSAINWAATFDDSLMNVVAKEIGAETRVLGFNMLLGPCINIARTPFGGRTFESFGEDPYLVSRMGVAFVKGVQSKRVATCTKHFACNNQEWNRMSVDVKVGERALREIYLPAFKAIVDEADGWTIMSAYNQTLGYYCCENQYLQREILKNQWGFTGAVVSDWGGVKSTIPTVKSGLDLEMPDGRYLGNDLLVAVKSGKIAEAEVTEMAARVLRVIFKAGLFDESTDTYGGVANTGARRDLALKVAEKSIVLLKNEKNFLPIGKEQYKSIALIGPNADVARMCGGGSGSNPGHYGISPLDGVKKILNGRNLAIGYKRGIALSKSTLKIVPSSMLQPPAGKPGPNGVWAEYFNNRELSGKPVLTRPEKNIDFDWGYGSARSNGGPGSPDPTVVNIDKWSARWTGKLISPGTGLFDIGCLADNGVRLYLDGKLVIDAWTDQAPGQFKIATYQFEAGKTYDLKVEFYENIGSCSCKFGLEVHKSGKELDEAVELARNSELTILCVGLNSDMEGEAKDRDELSLPPSQIELIQKVTAVNKNTLVVLNGATPITMNEWITQVPAVIDALYPGQEGGNALAEIIFGDVNPSGKLPLTFLKRWEDSPVFKTYPGSRDVANYDEGIYVGYRHFDKYGIEPLFPFGFGLSYTTFEYSNISVDKKTMHPGDQLLASVTIRNSGKTEGEEVAQLYISDLKSSVDREVKALKGFKRVHLKPGESVRVSFKIGKADLSYYDEKSKSFVAGPGMFEVLVGSSSRDIRQKTGFELIK